MQGLRTTGDGGERLDRNADDVVLRLLSSERGSTRLRVEAESDGPGIRSSEAIAHDPGPQSAGRPELGDLLEEVVVGVEEEREALAEVVRREARSDGGLAVGDPVRESEGELLRS